GAERPLVVVARAVDLPATDRPAAVRFERAALQPGLDLPPEAVQTRTGRELTAEEIIAAHQQVQRLQDDRLERWMAQGRIEYHFKLANAGSTVDVGVESNYFWERGHDLEWEQTSYTINGNRVRWKTFPEVPLIQPEKVLTLPLDLTLDRRYAYRLLGREPVEGREAYVLEFQPAGAGASADLRLYRGRVWIDTQNFVRLRANLLQPQLDPPVLSNEETDHYAAVNGPDGKSYWMLVKSEGQQVWNIAGRTLSVQRQVTFLSFEINPPAEQLEQRRRAAYASSNQMLRDTAQGFRYLEREPDGSVRVKDRADPDQLFVGGGVFRDESTDGVTPLAGVNYFNYDVARKNIQLNAFFAGPLGFFTASKPDLLGRRVDGTLDASFQALLFGDKVFAADTEIEHERVRTRSQNVALRLGLRAGQFVKLNWIGSLALRDYAPDEDAADAIAAYNADPGNARDLRFVLPADHRALGAALEAEFNRRGYTLRAGVRSVHRSRWRRFGLRDAASGETLAFDPAVGDFVPVPPEPLEPTFATWSLTAFKEWYLPKFQKLRAEVDLLGGSSLDRFSRYQFSYFGQDRLNGFSGSGVRFDRGVILRAGWAFNLFEVIRFDATIDGARVEQRDGNTDPQQFVGVGLSANVVGPWKTVISGSYGRAVASDIPELEGEQEFLLLVLKLF
ncbi:MAG TPA: hypothetical protein VJS92_01345, partial [Candidatus Polarisedimenticolaceae bacterium]|nr:hypothetical protein [Candidatus Polarisedimenticolaceae bacterium]